MLCDVACCCGCVVLCVCALRSCTENNAVCTFKTLPCVPSKRPCHFRHKRVDGTHASVLNAHTGASRQSLSLSLFSLSLFSVFLSLSISSDLYLPLLLSPLFSLFSLLPSPFSLLPSPLSFLPCLFSLLFALFSFFVDTVTGSDAHWSPHLGENLQPSWPVPRTWNMTLLVRWSTETQHYARTSTGPWKRSTCIVLTATQDRDQANSCPEARMHSSWRRQASGPIRSMPPPRVITTPTSRNLLSWPPGQHSLLEAPAAMAHNLTQSTLSFGDTTNMANRAGAAINTAITASLALER